jgi:hypothetical protein
MSKLLALSTLYVLPACRFSRAFSFCNSSASRSASNALVRQMPILLK